MRHLRPECRPEILLRHRRCGQRTGITKNPRADARTAARSQLQKQASHDCFDFTNSRSAAAFRSCLLGRRAVSRRSHGAHARPTGHLDVRCLAGPRGHDRPWSWQLDAFPDHRSLHVRRSCWSLIVDQARYRSCDHSRAHRLDPRANSTWVQSLCRPSRRGPRHLIRSGWRPDRHCRLSMDRRFVVRARPNSRIGCAGGFWGRGGVAWLGWSTRVSSRRGRLVHVDLSRIVLGRLFLAGHHGLRRRRSSGRRGRSLEGASLEGTSPGGASRDGGWPASARWLVSVGAATSTAWPPDGSSLPVVGVFSAASRVGTLCATAALPGPAGSDLALGSPFRSASFGSATSATEV